MQQTNEEPQKIVKQMAERLEVHDLTLDLDGNLYLSGNLYVPTTCREETLERVPQFIRITSAKHHDVSIFG